jgi:hypothetical protein
MSEISNLPAPRSSTSLELSRRTWNDKLRPAPVTETVAQLSTCLALVKPVGMSAEDTQAWLRVAAGELSHLPPDMLERGCKTARKTCTHHGQIVPAILKDVGQWYADVAEGARIAERMAKPVERLPAPEPWLPTTDELEAIKASVAAQFPSNRDDAA